MGPERAGMAPTSGPGWIRNAVKQSTWRIWTGPLRTRDGTWTGPGSDPGEGLDGTPRNSNRLLGLSDFLRIALRGAKNCESQVWGDSARIAPNLMTIQEPLNAPFLNGLFSSGFSRGKTAPQDAFGETPH